MTASRNLSVGLFVTAALLVGVAVTIWITGKKGSEPTTMYSILIEDDVTGLMLGGPVYFLGVRVGEVADMVIVPGDPARIRVDVRILSSAPVNAGTWATLAPQGITGVSIINLSNDPGQHPPLETSDRDQHPRIPYRSSGLSAIMSSAPRLVEKMEGLLDRASEILGSDNRETLTRTLANIESLTATLAEKEAAIQRLPDTFNAAMIDFRATVGRVDDLVVKAGPDAIEALDNLSRASAEFADAVGRLDGWTERNQSDLDEFAANGLGQVPALIGELRQATRELEKLLERIRKDPSRFIYKPENGAIEVED